MIIASYNVEKAADLLHIDALLAWALSVAPEALAAATAFLTDKWIFGFCTFITGLGVADRAIRGSMRTEMQAGLRADWLLTFKKFMAVRALRGTRPFVWLIDLSHEIRTLDVALRAPHRNLPALPCTDLSDAAGMLLTRRYLETVGPIRAAHLDEARTRAAAILGASHRPATQDQSADLRTRLRRAAMALLDEPQRPA